MRRGVASESLVSSVSDIARFTLPPAAVTPAVMSSSPDRNRLTVPSEGWPKSRVELKLCGFGFVLATTGLARGSLNDMARLT